MKLPSLQSLFQGAKRVFMRFPVQTILAIAATAIWWYLVDLDYKESDLRNYLLRTLFVSNLALALVFASDLFCESHHYSNVKKWGFRTIAIAICTGLFFILNPMIYESDIYRIFLFAFSFHLLVAFAPFIGRSNLNGFWQYNKSLFLRFLIAAFYAAALYAGLAIALTAINGLFNAHIKYDAYIKLFAVVSAGFTTIFFLAGVPENFEELAEDQSYPKGLKIFTQYVLIPLMTIYLAILLVYEVKILITWTLPKGLVSTLILGYAVFGILSLLLIYPIKDKQGNGWMKFFSRFFYFMMIPLVILLLLAICTRISKYSITESRYILFVLAFWLSGITIYFLFSKKQNIKIIPISLCIIALLATYGPQSAFSIAKFSQIARLKNLMQKKDKKSVGERANVVRYLVTHHGLTAVQKFTKVDLDRLEAKLEAKGEYRYNYVDTAFAILKVKEEEIDYGQYLNVENSNHGLLMPGGYDVLFHFNTSNAAVAYSFDQTTFKIDQQTTKEGSANQKKLKVTIGKSFLTFDLNKLVTDSYDLYKHDKLKTGDNAYDFPAEKMEFIQKTEKYTLKLVISDFYGYYDEAISGYSSINFGGYLLIKKN